MGVPLELIQQMHDDTKVLATVASIPDTPITSHVIDAVARWYQDVEILYPIAEMDLDETNKRSLTEAIATEMLSQFVTALESAKASGGELDSEPFQALGAAVDPLWRELAGVHAAVLNGSFQENRIEPEDTRDAIEQMLSAIERFSGPDGVNEFRSRARSDKTLRAHLRRMGLDPDQL